MKGEVIPESAVRFVRNFDASPEKIWRFLTDSSLLPEWYGEGAIEPREGGEVSLMGGHIKGTVTHWDPPKRLTYSWNVFAPGQGKSDFPESYLTLEIDGGKLTLTHLPVLEAFVKLNAMGWHTFLDMVDAAARGAPVEPREAYMKRNAERYGVTLPSPRA